MIERKCLNCGTWNKDEDYCVECKKPLSPKALDKEKEIQLRQEQKEAKPSKMEVYLNRARSSRYLLVRWGYYALYSLFVFVGLMGAVVAWMAAMANA
ncbi:MAG: hypothetical protein HUJ25_00855 [Crocinitomicaceae bacterium]|nr:hypothetical protein [Crocinitomicaceae bacterium]